MAYDVHAGLTSTRQQPDSKPTRPRLLRSCLQRLPIDQRHPGLTGTGAVFSHEKENPCVSITSPSPKSLSAFHAAGQQVPASWLAGYLKALGIKTTRGFDYDPNGRGIFRAIQCAYEAIVKIPGYQFVADAIAKTFTKADGKYAWR